MTMDEVREFERTIQEATNQKIGVIPPSISIGGTPLSSLAPTGPASAPSTPLCTDAPEFLSVPKERPRKKSAPDTLTLTQASQSEPAPNDSTLSPAPGQVEWGITQSESHRELVWFLPLHYVLQTSPEA